MKIISSFILLAFLSVSVTFAQAQIKPLSERLSDTLMNRIWVDDKTPPGIPAKWNYEQGVQLKAVEQMW